MSRIKTLWIKDEYLEHILGGRKTVEIRVAYSNIVCLRPGDTLLLNGQHPYTIVDIRRYPDFDNMVAAEDPDSRGGRIRDARHRPADTLCPAPRRTGNRRERTERAAAHGHRWRKRWFSGE